MGDSPVSSSFPCMGDLTKGRMPQVHPHVSSPEKVSVSNGDNDKFCAESSSSSSPETFTVWKRSLIFNAKGFRVYDSSGSVVFRVDNYSYDAKRRLFLMDAVGNVLLTIRQKRLSINNQWDAFGGDCYGRGIKPAFTVIKTSTAFFSSVPTAKVMLHPAERQNTNLVDYEIEGSLYEPRSSFTVFDASREIIVQATRKQGTYGITLGEDVLNLVVQPGIDQTIAMGLLVIFDRILCA